MKTRRLISLNMRRLALASNDDNEVLLTDVRKIVDRVLLPNVKMSDRKNTQVGVVDWFVEPGAIDWKAIRFVMNMTEQAMAYKAQTD